jgi:hypothetical protein
MDRLAALPGDMMFFTQVTLEAADDPEFLEAMQRARVGGVLIGVESVAEGSLAKVKKTFNSTGDRLVAQLRAFRDHRVMVLGSFIFGLPSDGDDIAARTIEVADRSGMAFAQFLMLAPFPRSVDFAVWEKKMVGSQIDGVPLSRYWLIPIHRRPRSFSDSAEIAAAVQAQTGEAWKQFYGLLRIWKRSAFATTLKARLMFVLLSKTFLHMYFHGGVSTDSARVKRSSWIVKQTSALAKRLFMAAPMPGLQMPRLCRPEDGAWRTFRQRRTEIRLMVLVVPTPYSTKRASDRQLPRLTARAQRWSARRAPALAAAAVAARAAAACAAAVARDLRRCRRTTPRWPPSASSHFSAHGRRRPCSNGASRVVLERILNELKSRQANRIKREMVGAAGVANGDRVRAEVGKRLQPRLEDRPHRVVALEIDAANFS